MSKYLRIGLGTLLLGIMAWCLIQYGPAERSKSQLLRDREEVVFWHFWGGEDRAVVDDVVKRFNQSQDQYMVRAIAMPGNNLHAKLFLSVTGGDPPDLVNQDDPVIPDWATRGVIQPIANIASESDLEQINEFLLPAADRLSRFDGQLYGLCNGLDIRALYYNQTLLDQYGLQPPETIAQLDQIATTIAPPSDQLYSTYGYLPDTRRLWSWGYVFGGDFFDFKNRQVHLASPEVIAALEWMNGYRSRYGADNIAAFRKADQSLPGKPFPLLPLTDQDQAGRYAMLMDGQWRVRNIIAFQQQRERRGLDVPQFGVCPLPAPPAGRRNAGWVNGNFFVIPRGANNARGAWEFAKFWVGYNDPESAAQTCAAGGWIPVSRSVIETAGFQQYLRENPMFQTFVELATSNQQYPIPQVVGAAMFKRTVESAAYEALQGGSEPTVALQGAERRIQQQLDRTRRHGGGR
jgi:multiple sugar transport system substrate-binding protein